jgi:HEAT repeat protein
VTQAAPQFTTSTPSGREPALEVGGVPFGPALAFWLYLMLGGSAALALSARHFPGIVPHSLQLAALALFLAFLVGFSLYRLRLVQARKYPAFKAFFQVGVGLLFLTLLLPGANNPYEAGERGVPELLSDSDPAVRAMAAEVVGYRPDGSRYGASLVGVLRDPDPRVREQAHRSLIRLNGKDLGPPDDEQAVRAWGARFR